MKALHRTIAGSAFGALAAATVAASAAYACHPTQQVELSTFQALPSQTVRVEANGFDPGTTLQIRWGDRTTAHTVLTTATVMAVEVNRPQVRVDVRVPAGVAPGAGYTISALQEPQNNTRQVTKAFEVLPAVVPGDQAPNPLPGSADPVPDRPAPVRPGDVSAVGTVSQPTPMAVVPAPAAARTEAAPASTPAVQADGQVAAPAAAVEDRRTPATDAPGQPSVLPVGAPAAPAAESLWSGLDAASVPALLDASAPPSQQGSAAVGMLLLGFGVATLAGIGFALGQRRLALATRR
jgi:hypothetical protein